jgi:hypothetical protein
MTLIALMKTDLPNPAQISVISEISGLHCRLSGA